MSLWGPWQKPHPFRQAKVPGRHCWSGCSSASWARSSGGSATLDLRGECSSTKILKPPPRTEGEVKASCGALVVPCRQLLRRGQAYKVLNSLRKLDSLDDRPPD